MRRFFGFLSRLGGDDLAAWGGPPPGHRPDRRATLRHPARDNQALVGWWDGREFRQIAASFRNISLGGGLVIAAEPPRSRRVWIRLEWPVKSQWRRARVMRIGLDGGQSATAVSFPELCDEELFDALVAGQACLLRVDDTSEGQYHLNVPPSMLPVRQPETSRDAE